MEPAVKLTLATPSVFWRVFGIAAWLVLGSAMYAYLAWWGVMPVLLLGVVAVVWYRQSAGRELQAVRSVCFGPVLHGTLTDDVVHDGFNTNPVSRLDYEDADGQRHSVRLARLDRWQLLVELQPHLGYFQRLFQSVRPVRALPVQFFHDTTGAGVVVLKAGRALWSCVVMDGPGLTRGVHGQS